MNEANTRRLFERFDHLYRGRYLLPVQNLMCDGFDCGDGWFDLIWQLSEQIERTMRLLGVTTLDELEPGHVTQLQRLAPVRR